MGRQSSESPDARERAASNEALVAEWRAGDLGAFRTLVRRCAGLVQEPASWLIPPGPLAEQASVRVFTRMFEAGRRFAPDVPVATWLVRQALAEGVSWRRKNPGAAMREKKSVAAAFAGETPEPDRLGEQLDSLKPDVHIPIMLRYLCGFSLSMVADVLAKPVDYVIGRLYIGLCEVWNIPDSHGGDAQCRPLALMEWIERALSDGSAQRVDEHVNKCERCAAHLEQLADAVSALTSHGDRARAESLPDLWQLFRLRSEKTREQAPPPAKLANRLTATAVVVATVMVALVLSLIPQFRAQIRQLAGAASVDVSERAPASVEPGSARPAVRPPRASPPALTEDDIAMTPPELPSLVPGAGPRVAEADAAAGASGAPEEGGPMADPNADESTEDRGPSARPAPSAPPVRIAPERQALRPRGPQRPAASSISKMEPAPPAGSSKDMTTRMIERAMDLAPENGR